ncbi:DEAD/DEAH box helicase [Planctomycetes bacterium TBK1r]|uniref:Ski2-like helicase n=1 Tax=Stieleria magnilauensis TaxID=2527963 RepID=A0ABX5Y2N7_9BACT|nr:ski2-like helicase [Planctomycetes bacterium TBK1r]
MSTSSLATRLYARDGFAHAYEKLVVFDTASQFAIISQDEGVSSDHDWANLLTCSSILAKGKRPEFEAAALRISQAVLSHRSTESVECDAACVVLDMLSNRAAINLAVSRELADPRFVDRLPFHLLAQYVGRDFSQSVSSQSADFLRLNRFQQDFWKAIDSSQCVSLSAPTSAGKSFVVLEWLKTRLNERTGSTVVYLVPTRALIRQVEEGVRASISQEQGDTFVSSIPSPVEDRGTRNVVYVLTQERAALLLPTFGETEKLDCLIVDEAHKVGDGVRGILLEHVTRQIVLQHRPSTALFLSPLISNPDVLLPLASGYLERVDLDSETVTVSQNLLWARQRLRKPQHWILSVWHQERERVLGAFELAERPSQASKRLPFVAYALGKDGGGNIVYANGAADAEKMARQLAELIKAREGMGEPNRELTDLVDLVKKAIHPRYVLVDVLPHGIACHYGNMPLLIRSEIERLFKEGVIRFLVCTSTLVEGVNLACRNVFVRGPKRGGNSPMSPEDFWNLAGRAGRLGKEFQGNIICVDPGDDNVWKVPAPTSRQRSTASRATKATLSKKEFLIFAANPSLPDGSKESLEWEHLLSYLSIISKREVGWAETDLLDILDEDSTMSLRSAIEESEAWDKVDVALATRNVGISPASLFRLIEYFETKLQDGVAVDDLTPVLPESEDAVSEYAEILGRINKTLAAAFRRNTFGQALLVVSWMRGHSLARIISERIAWEIRAGRETPLPGLIRSVMEQVESVARFLAPKYISCYVDVLSFVAKQMDSETDLKEMEEVKLWLEFGASSKTQLVLMSLGMTRTSSTFLCEIIVETDLGETEVVGWLKAQDLDAIDVPNVVRREARSALKRIGRVM